MKGRGTIGAMAALAAVVGGCVTQRTTVAASSYEALRVAPPPLALARGVTGVAMLGTDGPRLVPESVAIERSYGVEPGGGVRGIVAGVRVVSFASGAVQAAPDRLSQAPLSIEVLPDRLGGGALFAIGDVLWRADRWLARAQPIFRAPSTIRALWVGLDRVYAKLPSGALIALNPVTGAPIDHGALPPSPTITGFAALDGFRAVALADLRGVVATTDAGATWRTLAVPIEPREIVSTGDVITVWGLRDLDGFDVRPEGDFSRTPRRTSAKEKDAARPEPARTPLDSEVARIFGARPLAAAVTDGIPLADGSALVARDGALARVRLADGALLDLARDAYSLRPSRCHGIALENGAGFVCGEPQGRTHVYRYVPARRGLELALSFSTPRAVLAGGAGALAIRGPCAEDAVAPSLVPGANPVAVTYCIVDAAGNQREVALDPRWENARVVALRDGRFAVIEPPRTDVASGLLTVVTPSRAEKVSAQILFDESSEQARHVLTRGMWLDGFEERPSTNANGAASPVTLGGWVEHAGTLLGVELRLDGHARHGTFVRDAGTVVASGPFGLGWTSAQRGYETTDFGMTWRTVDLPEPVPTKQAGALRGCGPAGCALEGWIRVGWGDAPAQPAPNPHAVSVSRALTIPVLELSCEAVNRVRAKAPIAPVLDPRRPRSLDAGSWPFASPAAAPADFTPFFGVTPPAIHGEEVGTAFDVQELADHQRPGLLARAYVWGAKGIEWDATSRWSVRWTSPFAGSNEVSSTPPAAPPKALIEASRFAASGGSMRTLSGITLATSDDSRHALLLATRLTSSVVETFPIQLDDGRAPIEVRRSDNETFGRVEAALRFEGRWFMLAEPATSDPSSIVLWEIEAGVAREITRIPRVLPDGAPRSGAPRLAVRPGDGMLGVFVEGQPSPERSSATRWVLGIDAASGRAGELELLGTADFDGRPLTSCTGDEGGWAVDLPIGQQVRVTLAGRTPTVLRAPYGRVRMDRGRACVERLTAVFDGGPDELAKSVGHVSSPRTMEVGVMTGIARQGLRCGKP